MELNRLLIEGSGTLFMHILGVGLGFSHCDRRDWQDHSGYDRVSSLSLTGMGLARLQLHETNARVELYHPIRMMGRV